jgi:hypothetical protein
VKKWQWRLLRNEVYGISSSVCYIKDVVAMKSELSFLLSLLLEHKLPVGTKKALQNRIVEVETAMQQAPAKAQPQYQSTFSRPFPTIQSQVTGQAASTQKLLEKYPDLAPKNTHTDATHIPLQLEFIDPTPVFNTAAVNNAMADREALLSAARNGKGRSAPKVGGPK